MKDYKVIYGSHEVDGVYISKEKILYEDGQVDFVGSKYPKYVLEVISAALENLVINNIVDYSGLSSEAAYSYLWYIDKILVLGVLGRVHDLSRYSDYVDEYNTKIKLSVFIGNSNYGKISSPEDALNYEFKFAHPETYKDDIEKYIKTVFSFIFDYFEVTDEERKDVEVFIYETLTRMVQR